MLARAPARIRPKVIVVTRPWRRLVAVVRGLARLGIREWEIASRLRMKPKRVRLALSEGAGIWSSIEISRMRAAMRREASR